jgi:uncharacterized protein
MKNVKLFLDRYAFAVFAALTIVLSFAAYLLPLPRNWVPLVMVFIPALLAFALAGLGDGRDGVKSLLRKTARFRFRGKWWFIAGGIALLMRLAVSGLALGFGWLEKFHIRPLTPSSTALLGGLLIFSALLEEIGWRGYALPRLMNTHSPWFSSLVIGVLWGVVHLALHLPGMELERLPVLATLLQLVGLSILLTWLFLHGRRSVLLTAFFHAAQSFFVIFNDGIAPEQAMWLMALVWVVAGMVVMFTSRAMQSNRPHVLPSFPEAREET